MQGWTAKKGIALADLALAKVEIDRAKLDVEFTKIKAPITGKISRSLVTKGNLVNAGGGDTLLTTIVAVAPMYVYFDVDERSLELYRERRAKEVGPSADGKPPVIPIYLGLVGDGDRFPREGVIDFAENRLNPTTGTIKVRGVFPNKDGRLTPGQFARPPADWRKVHRPARHGSGHRHRPGAEVRAGGRHRQEGRISPRHARPARRRPADFPARRRHQVRRVDHR